MNKENTTTNGTRPVVVSGGGAGTLLTSYINSETTVVPFTFTFKTDVISDAPPSPTHPHRWFQEAPFKAVKVNISIKSIQSSSIVDII